MNEMIDTTRQHIINVLEYAVPVTGSDMLQSILSFILNEPLAPPTDIWIMRSFWKNIRRQPWSSIVGHLTINNEFEIISYRVNRGRWGQLKRVWKSNIVSTQYQNMWIYIGNSVRVN